MNRKLDVPECRFDDLTVGRGEENKKSRENLYLHLGIDGFCSKR